MHFQHAVELLAGLFDRLFGLRSGLAFGSFFAFGKRLAIFSDVFCRSVIVPLKSLLITRSAPPARASNSGARACRRS
jgi:hypothetical protein